MWSVETVGPKSDRQPVIHVGFCQLTFPVEKRVVLLRGVTFRYNKAAQTITLRFCQL
jgi:hypothetical protein